jgi:hypothetical protein
LFQLPHLPWGESTVGERTKVLLSKPLRLRLAPSQVQQLLQLQIFTTSSTTTSRSTSTTSSSPWDSTWSFKYLWRWFPTNLSATRCARHQLSQALLNRRLARPPSCCMRLWRPCDYRRWARRRLWSRCHTAFMVQGPSCNSVFFRGLICNLVA